MTNEQVIKYLEESKCNQKQGHKHQEIHDLALDLAIQALEKQIEVIPKYEGPTNQAKDDVEIYCPNCDYYFKDELVHCPDCGQKILWL